MGEHYFIDSDTYLLLNFSSCCYDAVQQGSGKCNLGFFLVNFVGRIKEVPYGTKKKSLFTTNLTTHNIHKITHHNNNNNVYNNEEEVAREP